MMSTSGKELFTVARIFGAYYELHSAETSYVRAVLKGKLRLKQSGDRHPFVVGDLVYAEPSQGDWVILEKLERKNYLTRKSDFGDSHVLCANLDLVAILASLKEPETKDGFIDRLLAASFHTKIPPLIVFTKADLVSNEEREQKEATYRALGYDVLSISMENLSSLAELKKHILGKTTFLCGNSGVGKSSLLNHLMAKDAQRVNEISQGTKKGKHTTTNSLAVFLEEETVIIDSPGVKEWGVLHLDQDELFSSFPELSSARANCSLEYCCDLGPSCQLLTAIEKDLSESRKKSLESMLESLEKPHRVTRRDHWSKSTTKRY
ncbi:GTPase [Leptospira ryugenii]|uniref:Small ribosomal subunit biogenesis GTPase RsgA n=2 Tax=Leptospira ryugenii TaxID=1917863 RepID=A0A2P2E1W7_9LEPT|nr:ribosome small subunit-dependent GTPase A [Leptospira ryugenii]GBF50861.1 GTPase [Leptospira ryugenii]